MIYNFTLSGWYGSTWWHSHYSTQYTDGISGAIVIHNRTQELAEPVDGELSIQLSDLYHRFSTDLLHQYLSRAGMTGQGLEGVTQGNEPVPDAGTINGVGQWGNYTSAYSNYTLGSNSTYRLRLANTGSFAAASFSVDDHPLIVVEADGVLVEPYQVSSLTIDVAQRYSVLLRTNQTAGAYWMRYTVSQDAFTYTENGGSYDIRGVLRYGVGASALPVDSATGADLSLQSMDTSRLVPAEAQNPPPANKWVLPLCPRLSRGIPADLNSRQLLHIQLVDAEHRRQPLARVRELDQLESAPGPSDAARSVGGDYAGCLDERQSVDRDDPRCERNPGRPGRLQQVRLPVLLALPRRD